MPRITSPADVHYLALEGGGGKGVTYLGAVRALERLGVLPIDINQPGHNQIRGISGASAGAITAMFLAMGYTSEELERVLSNAATFTGFFDGPSIGISRAVNRRNRPDRHVVATDDRRPPLTLIRQRRDDIRLLRHLATLVGRLAGSGLLGSTDDPILKRLIRSPEHYLYNLVFDRGLFPGLAARTFLQNALYGRLWDRLLRSRVAPGQPIPIMAITGSEINFQVFYELTGVDLVITGANVTRQKPAVFSRRHTPLFPVAEAVGISMNLPVLFKPVHVDVRVPVNEYNRSANDYQGLWIDGGVLNNLPLHAFNHLVTPPSADHPHLRPLHPNMLGLRLTDGPHTAAATPRPGTFDILLEHLGNITGTVLYPSEEGQIRSPDEREQTIDLRTYDLATTEFAPSREKRARPIAEAERAVNAYFGNSG